MGDLSSLTFRIWTCLISAWSVDVVRKNNTRLVTHMLKRIYPLGSFLNLPTNHLRNQLGGQLRKRTGRRFALDNLHHLLANGSNLRRPRIRRLLDLIRTSVGEGDSKETKQIIVGGLEGDVGLDESLPLSNERPQLIRGEVESVKVGQTILALYFVDSELDLAESMSLVLLQVGQ